MYAKEESPVKLKPLKLKAEHKPLPSIAASSPAQIQNMADELEQKRKLVEQQFKLNLQAQKNNREAEETVRAKAATVSTNNAADARAQEEEEARKRAEHMREQRDRIIAIKKKEREAKVAAEEQEKKIASNSNVDGIDDSEKLELLRRKAAKEDKGLSDEEIMEKQASDDSKRGAMRMALAHRMKIDLLTGAATSQTSQSASQQAKEFSDLEEKLRQMDSKREETRQRQVQLEEDITRQISTKANKR
jgi:hypothetical protein